MKILVFGAGGQVGQLLRATTPFPDAVFLDRANTDLCDRGAIQRALEAAHPDLVINVAAYTWVDRAESETALAHAANETGPANLAAGCAAWGARLFHLSTDHVFDGSASRAYRADDAPNPCNVYGASKLAGEQRVRETRGLLHLIIRTSWVYSGIGRNFFLSMLGLAGQHELVSVVADQFGSPTSGWTLADAIWRAARLPACTGTVHFTDGAGISRHEFARGILAAAAARGLPVGQVTVDAISSAQYSQEHPRTAPRPANGVLDSTEFRARIGLGAADWKVALAATVDRFCEIHHG